MTAAAVIVVTAATVIVAPVVGIGVTVVELVEVVMNWELVLLLRYSTIQ